MCQWGSEEPGSVTEYEWILVKINWAVSRKFSVEYDKFIIRSLHVSLKKEGFFGKNPYSFHDFKFGTVWAWFDISKIKYQNGKSENMPAKRLEWESSGIKVGISYKSLVNFDLHIIIYLLIIKFVSVRHCQKTKTPHFIHRVNNRKPKTKIHLKKESIKYLIKWTKITTTNSHWKNSETAVKPIRESFKRLVWAVNSLFNNNKTEKYNTWK